MPSVNDYAAQSLERYEKAKAEILEGKLANIKIESHEIDKRRDRRESFVSYGSLAIAVLSLLVTLVALCRPIHLNHHYTVTIPNFPALECYERCDKQEQNDNNGNHHVFDCIDVSNLP
jgi:hypothetical protein